MYNTGLMSLNMRFIVWGVEEGESEVHWGSRKYESSIIVINLGNLQGDM